MSRSIRKLVGGGAAALAIGVFFALIVGAQPAAPASVSHPTQVNEGLTNIVVRSSSLLKVAVAKKVVKAVHPAVTPSSACTTAKSNLAAALAQDKTEDATERANASSDANFKTADVAEDKDEYAARKPLVAAVAAACGSTKPAPSAQCSAALLSLKAAIQAEQGEDTAEKAAGTEGTPGDVSEDQAERTRMVPLFQAIRTNCVLSTHGAFSKLGSTKSFSFQR